MRKKDRVLIALSLARKHANSVNKKAEGGGTKLGIPTSDALTEITRQPMAAAWRGNRTVRVPIDQIEHGEAAMPGGTLTWPNSQQLIEEYAARPTPFPPIEAIPPDKEFPKWMVYDGSRRLEAAKLRGDTHIDVNPVGAE